MVTILIIINHYVYLTYDNMMLTYYLWVNMMINH
jgi:hypothetical protein